MSVCRICLRCSIVVCVIRTPALKTQVANVNVAISRRKFIANAGGSKAKPDGPSSLCELGPSPPPSYTVLYGILWEDPVNDGIYRFQVSMVTLEGPS